MRRGKCFVMDLNPDGREEVLVGYLARGNGGKSRASRERNG